ncbi:MAG: hypothetical protein JSU07_02805 [Bacteroidetes bacterium]|nr:hypothetical protein [Bacteroidota bacterium]
MNLDYTYINLFGFKFFEPITVGTNLILFLYCFFCFFKLIKVGDKVFKNWSLFFLLIGCGCLSGAIAHTIHFQYGENIFNFFKIFTNIFSLSAVYYFFIAANNYYNKDKNVTENKLKLTVKLWIFIAIIISVLHSNFLLIKINAAIVLIYSLIIHYLTVKNKQFGSLWICTGIALSFTSVFIHSLKWSLNPYFNYKDMSHVIMLISLILIYKGVNIKLLNFSIKLSEIG